MFGQAERVLELKRLKSESEINSEVKTFAFTSGKGGTGKTFLSLNIGYALSIQFKVLIIDLDPNLSNANIMINEIPKKTIYNFYSGQNLLEELITEYSSNLHFIFGDSGKLGYSQSRCGSVVQLFNQLKNIQHKYDFIFFDTGSGASDEIISILQKSDVNVLVTSPEPTAVMDAYVMIKLLNGNNYLGKKTVLINKCFDQDEGQTAFKNLESAVNHFLKEKLILMGMINSDRSVTESIIAQDLLLKKIPDSIVSQQIFNIADQINEFAHMANILHT